MRRILFLSSVYPRAYDPTRGTYCYALCKALATSHEIRVVSPQSWLDRLRHPHPGNAQFTRDVGPTDFPCFFYPPGVFRSTYGWWMWHSVRPSLLATVRQFRPEGILSYWAHPDGEVAVRLGQRLGVPVGIIVGGSDVLLLTHNPRRRKVISATLRSADAVFAVSQDLKERTVALGADPERVHVNYQGVDERFHPGDRAEACRRLGLPVEREVLLWVGRMVPVKGLETLLEACRQVVAKRPQVLLVLVGDGPSRAAIERQARDVRLAEHIRFVGAVRPENLPDWYRAAHLTVLSSHSEGIPNVLRESFACGTPYVATRVGGISELCKHPAVRLVAPQDPAALAAAIEDALESPQRIEEDFVERGWERCVERLVATLSGCVRSSQSAA
jgi:glycosyltransferase involved in cell wall biosynthesis